MMLGMTCFTILHVQINYVTFCTHDCKIWLLSMFLFIRYVAAWIYKNLSGDLSRRYVERTGGRIASYRRLTPPYLNYVRFTLNDELKRLATSYDHICTCN